LVELRDSSFDRIIDLDCKLQERIGRRVDVIELREAERDPALLARILAEGRVLVDRERRWPGLRDREPALRRRGARQDAARLRSALAGIDRLLASF
ncbi:MAG TPA: hypothetical protein VFR50_08620, partial [Casimicrobiaceae bacterium]|nr:hypothetical protein [Casimicrobiaceae bacterium]